MFFIFLFFCLLQVQTITATAVACLVFLLGRWIKAVKLETWIVWLKRYPVFKVMILTLLCELIALPISFMLLTMLQTSYAIEHHELVNGMFLGLVLLPWLLKAISVIRFVKETKKEGSPLSSL